jgi:hypothetical protein
MSQKGDFDAVRKDIVKLIHQPGYDDGSAGPVLVRLAWYVFCRLSLIHLLTTSSQALVRDL